MAKHTAFILAALLALATTVLADTLRLAWDDPDNPPGTVTGYKLYRGAVSGKYDSVADVGWTHVYQTEDLPPGTYYFAVSAYNAASESPKSGEAIGEVKAPIVLKAPATIVIKVE